MVTAKFNGSSMTSVYGLTQWDYGQVLQIASDIIIPDDTEVQFYQGELHALRYMKDSIVRIPDRMLQDSNAVTAYIYVRAEDSGETILTIHMQVVERQKPQDYVLPDSDECRRLLPIGGDPGEVIVKLEGGEYAVGWGYRADSAEYDGEYLQLMSGTVPVGERVRIMKDEREIELVNDGENIKWRYTDSNDWQILASLESLKGPPGPPGSPGVTPEFEVREGHLIAKYE